MDRTDPQTDYTEGSRSSSLADVNSGWVQRNLSQGMCLVPLFRAEPEEEQNPALKDQGRQVGFPSSSPVKLFTKESD